MAADSPLGLRPTWADGSRAILACVFPSEEPLAATVARLQPEFASAGDMGIGAVDRTRAQALGAQLGIRSDIDAADPLGGLPGLSTDSATRNAVDRGGLIGAALGALAGFALSFTPVAALMPVQPSARMLALAAFCFLVGTIAGSVLGAAFAPQSSSHAGFRLIDGMQDGGVVLIVAAPRERGDAVQEILESAGARGLTRL